MADLYPTYSNQFPPRQPSYSQSSSAQNNLYAPPQIVTSQPVSSDDHPNGHDDDSQSPTAPSPKQESPTASKPDGLQQPAKPQATFLTKLYALLERPENQHMIRWDPAGEHIIVERPEQLALHVLPSVYRQSRFASFSRQLNIYGFMRKVNLRNVDPAIDDPDASTWSHPTLNRHSPPETVANFKRRVPPRLPKPRKRDNMDTSPLNGPRSAVGTMAPVSLAIPSGPGSPGKGARARGFSAPGSFTPLTQSTAPGWGASYPRATLPPLTVPDGPAISSHSSMYSHSPHPLHPLTPADDTPASSFSPMSYSNTNSSRDALMLPSPSSQYPYSEQNGWQFSPSNGSSGHSNGSLSSLLNPSSSYVPSRPPVQSVSSYGSSYPSMQMRSGQVSPDSRPATGYSVSSISSLSTPYEETAPHQFGHHDYSRPNSSHHPSAARPITPTSRPHSSKASYPPSGSLLVRRDRRHSHAMSPYPSPYGDHPPQSAGSDRPSTSPHPGEDSMPTDYSGFNPAHADFAYHAGDEVRHSQTHLSHSGHGVYGGMQGAGRSIRPSTSASSLSTTSSVANTPGGDGYGPVGHESADISRYSPDFGFVQMNEQIPHYTKTGEY